MRTGSPESWKPPEADGGELGVPSPFRRGEGQRCRSRNWVHATDRLPGVVEDGMPRRREQRKHGTTRGSPRPRGTARASRISRSAAKSRCACEWGGWGRISEMARDNITRTGARAPGVGRRRSPERRCLTEPEASDTERMSQRGHGEHEGRTQTAQRQVRRTGRRRSKCRPLSRTGENPPYGILGGAMETSASFEARSAPSLYPTVLTLTSDF